MLTPFLNLSSLILGLTAWALGIAACRRSQPLCSFFSFTCCGLALVLQFFELRHRLALNDLSAVLDIYPAMATIAAVLLLGTVAVNALTLFRHRR